MSVLHVMQSCQPIILSRSAVGKFFRSFGMGPGTRGPAPGSGTTLLIGSAHTVSLFRCGRQHRSFCQFRRITWTLVLVVSLLLLQDSGTRFLRTVELLHLLLHLRPGSRHFSLFRHNPHCSTRLCTMARYKCIDWLIARQLLTYFHFSSYPARNVIVWSTCCVLAVHRSGTQLPQQLRRSDGDQRGRLRDLARYDAQVTRTSHVRLYRHRKRLHRKPHTLLWFPLCLVVNEMKWKCIDF